MRDTVRVDLFGEDRAHEAFGAALVRRLGAEEGVRPDLRAVSSRGGLGRALMELQAYQRPFARGLASGTPDVLAVLIDANTVGVAARRREIEAMIDATVIPRSVIGCPDPHVERWYCADASSFARVVGASPVAPTGNDRSGWKRALAQAVEAGEVVSLDDGIDLAPELVEAMDLGRAGRSEPSLGAFVDDLRRAIRGAAA